MFSDPLSERRYPVHLLYLQFHCHQGIRLYPHCRPSPHYPYLLYQRNLRSGYLHCLCPYLSPVPERYPLWSSPVHLLQAHCYLRFPECHLHLRNPLHLQYHLPLRPLHRSHHCFRKYSDPPVPELLLHHHNRNPAVRSAPEALRSC